MKKAKPLSPKQRVLLDKFDSTWKCAPTFSHVATLLSLQDRGLIEGRLNPRIKGGRSGLSYNSIGYQWRLIPPTDISVAQLRAHLASDSRVMIAFDDSGTHFRHTLWVQHDNDSGEVSYAAKPLQSLQGENAKRLRQVICDFLAELS